MQVMLDLQVEVEEVEEVEEDKLILAAAAVMEMVGKVRVEGGKAMVEVEVLVDLQRGVMAIPEMQVETQLHLEILEIKVMEILEIR